MRLTDSHCHLTMTGADAALERARAAGVCGFIVPATKADDLQSAVDLAAAHDDVWAAAGFHPHEAKDCDDAAFAAVAAAASAQRVVAIGEVGLDYHYMHSPRETQREVLLRHIALAKERNLPVIVHNRESSADLIELLRSDEARGVRGILHSFTESSEVAKQLLDLGFYISFSGILTFRTAEPLREAARQMPHDRVLVETDSPFLAPVPHRGKENEPAFVDRVVATLAALWNVSDERAAAVTADNFESAFSVRLPR